MPVVPETTRLNELRRLGLSEPVVRLAAGDHPHPAFRFACQGPWAAYHAAAVPDGPPLAPLWQCSGGVTGVWVQDGRPEFIEVNIETDSDEYEVLAHTEQGLLARLFFDLVEYEANDRGDDDLPGAAAAVGFRYLDEVRAVCFSDEGPTDERVQALVDAVDVRHGWPGRPPA
jgi:hypothetical protein